MNLDTYLVTAERLSEDRSTVEIVESAIDGGIDLVQLREKEMPARDRYDLGQELRELTRAAGVPLIVNDRIGLAAAIDADGVHLGDEDLPIAVAREQLGEAAIVGRSVSTAEAAREAERAGADYLGVGAVYPTDSKDTNPEGTEIGLDRIEAVAEAVEIPIVGIGGVKPDNAAAVIGAGADGVAVISAITAADDPAAATRELGAAVERGRESR
ncbi:thiamine-phosphate diphosphorylase [Halorientalis persicus]|uniref:Thiamine-phosphate synthase n=1 Tax=Halorientalis persicus TaxID=1367881 RepID=A0A1H8G6I5_9EURY|nr:thiamine phosphate synthase [Halorientalis persicus]SEN39364.1 thiamine-phosphate diphosphorylase [Halorientalis persicus]